MELAHATCPALTPDLMFLSNSAQLPLKRLHVQRTVKISKKATSLLEKPRPSKKHSWIFWMNSGFAYRRILSDIIAYVKTTYIIFFKKEEAQECFLSKIRIFYEMNVSVVIFIIYLYWHLFNKVLYVFHICCIWRIFFCVCHKQEPYLKDWYD